MANYIGLIMNSKCQQALVSILHRLKQEYEHNYGEINKSGYKAFTIHIMLHT